MSSRRHEARVGIHVRMRPDLVEALEETSEELTMSRNKIIEVAVEEYLRRLELPGVER